MEHGISALQCGQKQRISHQAYALIQSTIGSLPAESGGVIACDNKNQIVDFYYDHDAGSGKGRYVPSTRMIAEHVNGEWHEKGYHVCGFVHSHPTYGTCQPSSADILYADAILKANGLKTMLLIILCNGKYQCYRLHADRSGAEHISQIGLFVYDEKESNCLQCL